MAIALLSLAGLLATDVRAARAQTAADLFDPGTVQEIRIFMNSKDLAELRAHFEDNTKYTADLVWRGLRVRNISVRSRGSGSRNGIKIGIQISFDHYTGFQRFVGLSTLVLKNEWEDPALLREQIAMAFYNRMGVLAPREGWCRLYVNSEYWGVYGIVEDVTADFLTYFGEPVPRAARGEGGDDSSGYLFEFHWQRYWNGDYLGDDLANYRPWFGPVTHELDVDTLLYPPIRDLFREINGPDDTVWRDRVGQFVDLKEFMKFVAIEVYLSEWDGMTGNWGISNFYVYRPMGTVLHHLIPWDRDNSMLQTTGDMSIFMRTDDNVIFHRAMAYSELRTVYLDTLKQCAEMAVKDDWFRTQIAQTATIIADAVHEETQKNGTNANFDAEIQNLMTFAKVRPGYVLQAVDTELAKARPAQ